ncbi:MAG: COX15/CtaA family protein [Gemmatimonadetes bacterium]|nr:COX15/CtaA family protein [Gemmatimonadota bacterium]
MNQQVPEGTAGYRRIAMIATGFTVGLITLGGYVRITGAGMGCSDHWPLCNGRLLPNLADTLEVLEWSHRWVAVMVSGAIAGLVAIAARRAPPGRLAPHARLPGRRAAGPPGGARRRHGEALERRPLGGHSPDQRHDPAGGAGGGGAPLRRASPRRHSPERRPPLQARAGPGLRLPAGLLRRPRRQLRRRPLLPRLPPLRRPGGAPGQWPGPAAVGAPDPGVPLPGPRLCHGGCQPEVHG